MRQLLANWIREMYLYSQLHSTFFNKKLHIDAVYHFCDLELGGMPRGCNTYKNTYNQKKN